MSALIREARARVRAAGTAGSGQSGGATGDLYMNRTIEFPEQAPTPLEPRQDITVPHHEYNRFSCAVGVARRSAQCGRATWKGAWFPRAASGLPGLLNARCARVDSGARQRLSPPDATSGRTGGPPLRRETPLHPRETGTDALRGGHPPPSSPPTPRSKPPGSTVRRSPYLTVFLLPFHADACDDASCRTTRSLPCIRAALRSAPTPWSASLATGPSSGCGGTTGRHGLACPSAHGEPHRLNATNSHLQIIMISI